MTIHRAALSEIVARASTLAERLAMPQSHSVASAHASTVDARLARWRTVVASGDESSFRRYLGWNGWSPEVASAVLHPPANNEQDPLPSWSGWLIAALNEATHIAARPAPLATLRHDRAIRVDAPIAFEECLLPFVRVARRRFGRSVSRDAALARHARICLERQLLEALSSTAEQTLFAEFCLFRAQGDASLRNAAGLIFGKRRGYDAFIADLIAGGLQRLLTRYPVLARLLATRVQYWLASSLELARRLVADREALSEMLAGGSALGHVVKIDGGLSDPHCQGRQVAIVHFGGGASVVYKPRVAQLECEWSSLLTTLNSSLPDLPLRVLRHLPRAHHVWVEVATAAPCADAAQVERLYERGGMLLCLAYLLGGTDLHYENVLACGEHAVLLDVEALLVPHLEKVTSDSARPITSQVEGTFMWESVLRTGLVPTLHAGPGGAMHLVGGFVDWRTPHAPKRSTMEHVNTDGMRLVTIGERAPSSSAPRSVDQTGSGKQHVPALARGFARMYAVLDTRRAELLAPDGALTRLSGLRSRVVLRNTAAYLMVLRRALYPRFLTDGADFGIELEVMRTVVTTAAARPTHWDARVAEVDQLSMGDVPIFWTRTDGKDVESQAGVCVVGAVNESAFDAACARISAMSSEELASQLNFIDGSMRALDAERQRPRAIRTTIVSAANSAPFRVAAANIADEVLQTAIDSADGIEWTGLMRRSATSTRLVPLGWSLFDGRTGVALFLAAAARMTGEPRYRDAARRSVRPLLAILQDSAARRRLVSEMGIGGGTGVGGIAYALARAAKWMDDEELLDGAMAAALAVTPARIERDRAFDLVLGSAGAALGLLAVHAVSPQSTVLEQARACGDWLLRHQTVRGGTNGGRGWAVPTHDNTGFAHGAPGMGHALLRLFEATGDTAYRDGARDAFAFEPHVQRELRSAMDWSWCHGATGAGLARLRELDVRDAPEAQAAVDAVLAAAERANVRGADQLCCGTLSRTELLLTAAQRLHRPSLAEHARAIAASAVDAARHRRTYCLTAGQTYTPMLFQGTAGIGYQLLRLDDPATFPSPLLWE